MNKRELKKNVKYLEENDIKFYGQASPDKPFSGELKTYTNAGEDMIICLEVVGKEHLQEYIDNFDINEEVLLWWRNGEDVARSKGVPFMNIRDHYDDYENYLDRLQEICNKMPY